jgi:hypothetical protein
METQLYMVGQTIIAGQHTDLTNIEDTELVEITRLCEALDRCAAPDSNKQALQAHITLVWALWKEIRMLPSESGGQTQ